MTSQVEVPPLTGLIHFISGKRRVKLNKFPKTIYILEQFNFNFSMSGYVISIFIEKNIIIEMTVPEAIQTSLITFHAG